MPTTITGTSGVSLVAPSGVVSSSITPAAVTPDKLSGNQTGTAPIYGARVWCTFTGSTGAIQASGNVSSVTRNGVGDYTITFTTALPDTAFAAMVMVGGLAASTASRTYEDATTRTTTTIRIATYNSANGGNLDCPFVSVVIFR